VIDIVAGNPIGKESGGAIHRYRERAASWRTLDRVGVSWIAPNRRDHERLPEPIMDWDGA